MSAGCGVSSFAHNEKNIRCITDDHNTSNILKRGVVVYNRVVLVFVGKTRLPFSCQSGIIVFHYYNYHFFLPACTMLKILLMYYLQISFSNTSTISIWYLNFANSIERQPSVPVL